MMMAPVLSLRVPETVAASRHAGRRRRIQLKK
jgi:hypothetical protein